MKSKIYNLFLFLTIVLVFFVSPNTADALEKISFYLGGKIGYNHTLVGSGNLTHITGAPTDTLRSSHSGAAPFILAAGMELPVLKDKVALRAELELGLILPSNNNAKLTNKAFLINSTTTEIGIQTLLANIFLDVYLSKIFYVYVTTGIGVATIDRKVISPISQKLDQNITFTWNAGGGIGHYITENTFFDIGLRYSDFSSAKPANLHELSSRLSTLDYSAIQLLFTVAYKF